MSQNSIDNNAYIPESILGGDNILLCCCAPVYKITPPSPNYNKMYPIGLVQGLSTSTGRPIRQVSELGSNAKYLLTSSGMKQISASRIMTTKASFFKACYKWYIKHGNSGNPPNTNTLPQGNIWIDMDHPLLKKPLGLCMLTFQINTDNSRSYIESVYMDNVTLSSNASQYAEREVGVGENITMTWTNTTNIIGANGSDIIWGD